MNHKLVCAEFSKHGYPHNPFLSPVGKECGFFETANKQIAAKTIRDVIEASQIMMIFQ
jgi:hypothetical protein